MTGDERDRPGWTEREKLSFSELDRRRRERRTSGGGQGPPRGSPAAARVEAATKQYLTEIDRLFAKEGGSAEARRLAAAMRDAHGSPGLPEACRAYRQAIGIPGEASLLALFLDSGDLPLLLDGLRGLRALQEAGRLQASGGLKSQLRMLAEHANDDVAEGAEELLALL